MENEREKFSIEDYERAVNELTGSTLGHKSEAAFAGLFDDMRLQDTRLGDTVSERTDKISKVIAKIGEIDNKSKLDIVVWLKTNWFGIVGILGILYTVIKTII